MRKNSKYLSLLLRHNPEKEGLKLDEYGWCNVDELLKKLGMAKNELDLIVESNDKKRFRYNNDHTQIKANQGHSIKITPDFKQPSHLPKFLYHGTSILLKDKILKEGIKPMSRDFVHLSGDVKTARMVGMRHAKNENNLWIIKIESHDLKNAYPIFISENGVFLVKKVPPEFIT